MWQLFVFLSIAFGAIIAKGEVAPICDTEKCMDILPRYPIDDIENLFPDKERLKLHCPDFIRFVECMFKDYIGCLGKTSQELISSENKTVADTVTVFLGVAGIIEDLCDPSSSLHEAYATNIVCSREVLNDLRLKGTCRDEANSLYESFKGAQEETGDSIVEEYKECLLSAYEYGCDSSKLLELCGKGAHTLYLTVLKRTNLLKYGTCSTEGFLELRQKFAAHLEEDRRNALRQLFELRRK